MEKSDRTEKREAIRTVEKGKHTGKIAPLSAGKQATAKTDSKEEINGQRTMAVYNWYIYWVDFRIYSRNTYASVDS